MQGGIREPAKGTRETAPSAPRDAGVSADDIQMRELEEYPESEEEQELVLEEVQELEEVDKEGTPGEAGRGLSAEQLVAVQLYKVLADYIVCLPSAVKDARIDVARLVPSPPEVGLPMYHTPVYCTVFKSPPPLNFSLFFPPFFLFLLFCGLAGSTFRPSALSFFSLTRMA